MTWKPLSLHIHDHTARLRLLSDLLASGAKLNNARLGVSRGEFRLEVVSNAQHGESLATIPKSACLGMTSISPPVTAFFQNILEKHWPVCLATRLVEEQTRHSSSQWSSYITLLPLSFPALPLFFSLQQMRELQYQPLIPMILDRNKTVAHAARLIDGPEDSLARLAWATASVSTRAFSASGPLPLPTQQPVPAQQPAKFLLPFIDMANHSFTPTASLSTRVDGGFSLLAERDVRAGEEITICCAFVAT